MSVAVDHLVVAAATLEQGAAWCQATLGVTPGPGGQHPLMGTHNRLVKIAGPAFPLAYLEIIAMDPDAAAPARPRWFGLDEPALRARLAKSPRLIHWVARSTMLDMHRWGLITVGQRPGDPVKASRPVASGTLSWEILVAEDGRPDCNGALPTLIQWHSPHPAETMADSGVSLQALVIGGVPVRARDVLRPRGISWRDEPGLAATLNTPRGDVTLHSTSDHDGD
ncbi:MAG TPA: VOC family protein [Rubrivivax sp.]|nr:VOC family protein [Rubrivivax sp.]